jgi:hypothetical protein
MGKKMEGEARRQVFVDEIKTLGRQAGGQRRGEDRGAVVGCLVVDELQ